MNTELRDYLMKIAVLKQTNNFSNMFSVHAGARIDMARSLLKDFFGLVMDDKSCKVAK